MDSTRTNKCVIPPTKLVGKSSLRECSPCIRLCTCLLLLTTHGTYSGPVSDTFLINHLQKPVQAFENISMVPEVEVEEGETVIINCSVYSVPTAQLVWTRGSKILRVVDSNFDSLVLHNASQYHLKVFHCQASNKKFFTQFLEAYTQIRIKGTYETIPKPSLSGDGSLQVLHQPFKLTCFVNLPQNYVNIRLTYTWFKDHREIPGQSTEVLEFPSLSREDGGVYACRAMNKKPETTSPESNEEKVSVLMPPRVHMEPATPDKVIRRAAGEELTLTCKVTEALPWVSHNGYSWSYLPSSLGQLQFLAVKESTLRLGPLTRADSGQYFCQARNDLEVFQGQIPPGNASITVDILYMEQIHLTPDLQVNKGDNLTLTCSVDSYPAAHLSWIVDGGEVRHVNDNVDHYILQSAACSDSKTYTCRVSNPDLPGLEKNASTYVKVACNEDLTILTPPSPTPSNPAGRSMTDPSQLLLQLLPQIIFGILLMIVIFTVIMFFRYHQRLLHPSANEPKVDSQEKQALNTQDPPSDAV